MASYYLGRKIPSGGGANVEREMNGVFSVHSIADTHFWDGRFWRHVGRSAVKKLLMVVAAGAALSSAGIASAQYSGQYRDSGRYAGGYNQNNDWDNRNQSYASFEQQYRHTLDGIRHGLNDGTFSRARANEFYRELQSIRRTAYLSQQSGNYRYDYVQARLARLHERMHVRHDRAHDQDYGYGGYDSRYRGDQPRYQRNDHHDHDGDDDDDDD